MSVEATKLKRLTENFKKHTASYKASMNLHKSRISILEQKNAKPKIRPSIVIKNKDIYLRRPKISANLSNKTV